MREHIVPLQKMLVEAPPQTLGWMQCAHGILMQNRKAQNHCILLKQARNWPKSHRGISTRLRPFFSECLNTMVDMKRLDLESRKGKAPGGYNCPLAETGCHLYL